MRVFGMGVCRVLVVVIMVMMVVPVVVIMVVLILRREPAHAGAECVTQFAIGHVRSRRICPLAFDVVVVAFLYGTDFAFKAQHLRTVFAQNTCWRRDRPKGRMTAIFDTDFMGLAVF
jgi:hypothetical protein